MKRYYLTLFLVFVSLTIAFAERPTWPTLNAIPVQCNFGYKEVATPSFDINEVTAVALSSYLPAETIGFEIRAKVGAIIIGHADNIATGTDRIGRLISEGESFTWNGLAGTFDGVIISNTGTATVVIDGAWGQYEE